MAGWTMKRPRPLVVAAATLFMTTARASEVGHFAPGVLNIRDFVVPAPGYYLVLYNYGYSSDRLNDSKGDAIDSVTIAPGVTLGVSVDLDAYALSPTFIWVSPWTIGGGKYAAYISPYFGNTSVGAALTSSTGTGRGAEASQFAMGDLFVQPFWLGWSKRHWDFAVGYGFYAPIGKYDTETITLPVVGPLTVEAADNIGLGFWTHQIQGAASWYPWADQRMAVATALTYEINGYKQDFDLRPGQILTLNWGVSQYLSLKRDQTLLLEVGVAGYDSWQIIDDSGSAAATLPATDQVDAVGAQIGLSVVPWNASLSFHYFYEFASEDRFQGESIGLNFAIKF